MIGRLIVFEGVEGCGKTTQINKLYDWLSREQGLVCLEGHHDNTNAYPPILLTREPGGTELGQMIRGIVLGQAPTKLICQPSPVMGCSP